MSDKRESKEKEKICLGVYITKELHSELSAVSQKKKSPLVKSCEKRSKSMSRKTSKEEAICFRKRNGSKWSNYKKTLSFNSQGNR